jgi:hypothetical protein
LSFASGFYGYPYKRAPIMATTPNTAARNRTRGTYSRAGQRLREIERIIKDRHGIVLATDDADLYLNPVAECLRKIAVDRGRPASVDSVTDRFGFWCQRWAPHVTASEAAQLVRGVFARTSKWTTDDDLGASLRLGYADRTRLAIRTIGSHDVNKKARARLTKARRRERDRLRAAEKRKANGATPRAVYLATSLSATQPWKQMGISRRTYYRRIGTSASPHPSIVRGDALVPFAPSTQETPAIGSTRPPATAVGIPSKTFWYGVDGCAVDGDDRKRFKTRFSTSMRLSKEARAYALAACFEPAKVDRMFEMFTSWNISKGSYSLDWDAAWCSWVDREVDITNEDYSRTRARAYWESRA